MPTIIVFDGGQMVTLDREREEIYPIGVPLVELKPILDRQSSADVKKIILSAEEEENPMLQEEIAFLKNIEERIDETLETLTKLRPQVEIIAISLEKICPSAENMQIKTVTFHYGNHAETHDYNKEWLYRLLSSYINENEYYRKRCKQKSVRKASARKVKHLLFMSKPKERTARSRWAMGSQEFRRQNKEH